MGLTARKRVPRLASITCFLFGLLNLFSVTPLGIHSSASGEFNLVPGITENAVAAAAASAALILWFIAGGLARRQKRALQIAITLLIISLGFRLFSIEEVHLRAIVPLFINAGLLMLLVWAREEFNATSEPVSGHRLPTTVALLFVASALVGFTFVSIRAQELGLHQQLATRLLEVGEGLAGIPTPIDLQDSRHADLLYYGLLGFGLTLALILIFYLLRVPLHIARNAHSSRDQITQLLTTTEHSDSLAYFALRPEKGILWARDHTACIAYSVVQGVMLASGDPIGNENAWETLIQEFGTHAQANAWIPASAGISERSKDLWLTQLGLSSFEIGDEAVIDTHVFTLDGRPMKNVRNSSTRAHRSGLSFHLKRVAQIEKPDADAFQVLADRWRQGNVERGHSMALGRVCHRDDPDAVMAWATLDGETQGFLQFVPWGIKDWSLDLMRRSPSAPSGIMEFLIVNSIALAKETDVSKISLNFAPFRNLMTQTESNRLLLWKRPQHLLALFAARQSQAQTLAKFSQKFQPQWQPRFLVYPGPMSFVRVASAYLRAEAFLPRPRNWTQHMSSKS